MAQPALKHHETFPSIFSSHTDYMEFCLDLADRKFSGYHSIREIEKNLQDINAYPRLESLEPPKNLIMLDRTCYSRAHYIKAVKCILEGRLFSEHYAAGEGTRLKLSTKYLINIKQDLDISKIAEMIQNETGCPTSPDHVSKQIKCPPSALLPLSLGARHMLQFSYDLCRLAQSMNQDPKRVLSRQKMLMVLNEASADQIINEFFACDFFGFQPCNVLFMVQKSYHGINLDESGCYHDLASPERLHNHGHIPLSQTMTNEIFTTQKGKGRTYLSDDEFGLLLSEMDVKVSYNIEDLDFLNRSIDLEGLCLSLKERQNGCRMLMEVMPNNPLAPQKGGMAAFDPALNRDVMIESFQLKGIRNSEISFLNKNINYFPDPYDAWEMVRHHGLNMHTAVKDNYLYFQPVIGDINFLVKTSIFMRKNARPIHAWKSAVNTPMAVNHMHIQDHQNGFRSYISTYMKGGIK